MKIYLASDHAGFDLKEKIKKFLVKEDYDVEDIGPQSYNAQDDYPDFIIPAAKKVAEHNSNRGIILGGSGQGEAIAANKVKGIRAAVYYGSNEDIVELSRTHNDANILSLSARFLTEKEALQAVKLWLETPFSNDEKHRRRINKISQFEKTNR